MCAPLFFSYKAKKAIFSSNTRQKRLQLSTLYNRLLTGTWQTFTQMFP